MPPAPLARDSSGQSFDLPAAAAFWRVSKITGGRPRVVGHVPVSYSERDLATQCEPGSYRLEAVDVNHRPVGAPVVVVDLAGDPYAAPSGLPSSGGDGARAPWDTMSRAMEAMQRSQHARESQMGDRERWQMQALIESHKESMRAAVEFNRNMAQLCTAVVERLRPLSNVATAAVSTDPIDILKRHAEVQKLLEDQRRNALPPAQPEPPIADEQDEEDDDEPKPKSWLAHLSETTKAVPQLGAMLTGLGASASVWVDRQLHGNDPAALAEVRNRANQFATMAALNSERDMPPVVAEVFAQFSDDERRRLMPHLANASDEEITTLANILGVMPSLEARVQWARLQVAPLLAQPPAAPAASAPVSSPPPESSVAAAPPLPATEASAPPPAEAQAFGWPPALESADPVVDETPPPVDDEEPAASPPLGFDASALPSELAPIAPVFAALHPDEAHAIVGEIFGPMNLANMKRYAAALAALPLAVAVERLRKALAAQRAHAARFALRAMQQALGDLETPPTSGDGSKDAA